MSKVQIQHESVDEGSPVEVDIDLTTTADHSQGDGNVVRFVLITDPVGSGNHNTLLRFAEAERVSGIPARVTANGYMWRINRLDDDIFLRPTTLREDLNDAWDALTSRSFDGTTVDEEQDAGGVYELRDADQNVIYIGSGKVKARLQAHLSGREGPCTQRASYYRVDYRSDYIAEERRRYDEYVRTHRRRPRCNDRRP